VDVIGHTDSDGSETSNEALSRARAESVLSLFRHQPLDALDIRASGLGSAAPLVRGADEDDKRRNRRVSFRVRLPDDPASPGQP
jgi:OOP family OmpA-OmpF porin